MSCLVFRKILVAFVTLQVNVSVSHHIDLNSSTTGFINKGSKSWCLDSKRCCCFFVSSLEIIRRITDLWSRNFFLSLSFTEHVPNKTLYMAYNMPLSCSAVSFFIRTLRCSAVDWTRNSNNGRCVCVFMVADYKAGWLVSSLFKLLKSSSLM